MSYDEIFTAFYTQFRVDANIPTGPGVSDSTKWDDQYTIGMRLANEAIHWWQHYDGTYWKELYDTYQSSGDGESIIVGQTTYDGPSDMVEAGGFVKIIDSNGNTVRSYAIVEPQEAQFQRDDAKYVYFTGDPNNGLTLNMNPAPDTAIGGMNIDFVYYKSPTEFASGSDITEMSNPYFIVNRMLANYFRGSRNPYYQSALRDSENELRIMQAENNSGSWANPWKLADNSGANFGASSSGESILGG